MAIDATISAGKSLLVACLLALPACSTPPAQMLPSKVDRQASKQVIRISAVGDIMLGGTSEPVLQQYGYDYPFENVKHLFSDSNIVIGNLEGPLTHSETPVAENKQYLFRAPPDQVAPALKNAGFTIMNLANNHILDYGPQGLIDTQRALHQAGIHTVGAGHNLHQARQGTILDVHNKKIGFLSYSLTFPKSFWADDDRPGTAFGHEKQIRQDIKRMMRHADLLVVSFHWGQEKTTVLREYQPMLAHAAIDEGASLVIGHHPHILQAVEKYKQGIILYSLGNFTFGSYSRAADTSVVATVEFRDLQFHSLQLVPINVLNVEVNFQPRLLLEAEAASVINRLNQLSRQQNTHLGNQKGVAFLYNDTNMSRSMSLMH